MAENTVYDYNAIAECNAAFRAEITRMHGDIDTFQAEVAKLVGDTWGGTAADGYNAAADGLNTDLQNRTNTLMELDKKLGLSADAMSEADRRGDKAIQSSV